MPDTTRQRADRSLASTWNTHSHGDGRAAETVRPRFLIVDPARGPRAPDGPNDPARVVLRVLTSAPCQASQSPGEPWSANVRLQGNRAGDVQLHSRWGRRRCSGR